MGGRIQILIIGVAVVGATAVFGWYVFVHKPSADVTSDTAVCNDGTAHCFTAPAVLAGSNDNPATLESVVVDDQGISLAQAEVAPSPAPSLLSPTTLKYRLIDQFGSVYICEPVSRINYDFPAVAADGELLAAIKQRLSLTVDTSQLTDQQKRMIQGEAENLKRIVLTLISGSADRYTFTGSFLSSPSAAAAVTGAIS